MAPRPSPLQLALALHRYLGEHPVRPMNWHSNHCGHFAAGWVAAATGRWPMQGLADTVTLRDTLRLLGSLGDTLEAAATQCMGWGPVDARLAQLGDVVLAPRPQAADQPAGAALGLCNGRTAVFLCAEGLQQHMPMDTCTHAWPLWGPRA